jgi:hypothetical protein
MSHFPILSTLIAVAASGAVTQTQGYGLFFRFAESPVPSYSEAHIRLLDGRFVKSDGALPHDSLRVTLLANGKTLHPPATSWYDDKDSSWLRYRTADAGTYVIGVSTPPKIVELPAADFIARLKSDGMPATLEAFEKHGNPGRVRERFSKHVRAVVQVGDKRTDDYSTPLGYPIEILLDKNPSEMPFGQEMSFRVLYKGKPLAGHRVKAGYEGFHEHEPSGNHIDALPLYTDQDGRASFPLDVPTPYYISLIYTQKVDEPGLDYESHWATLTFDVK